MWGEMDIRAIQRETPWLPVIARAELDELMPSAMGEPLLECLVDSLRSLERRASWSFVFDAPLAKTWFGALLRRSKPMVGVRGWDCIPLYPAARLLTELALEVKQREERNVSIIQAMELSLLQVMRFPDWRQRGKQVGQLWVDWSACTSSAPSLQQRVFRASRTPLSSAIRVSS